MKSESRVNSTEEDRGGEVLCVASAKGGSGKTIISATIAYLLARSGRKVVTIDSDFSTRGLSIYLLGETVRNKELQIPKESCLADTFMSATAVEKLQPREIHLGATVYNIVFSNHDLWRSGVPDDRLLGVDQKQWQERGGVESYLRFLAALCDRFRREYDHVIIDTRGGYDYSTAVPAILADGYVIVMEADPVSLNQVFGFIKSIKHFAEEHQMQEAVRGVIINKAPFSPWNKMLRDTLSNLLGLKTYGIIPADIHTIEAYQQNRIPSEMYPQSDFAYFSLKVFRNLIAPDENWTTGEALNSAESFKIASEEIERKWTVRRSLDNVQRRVPLAQILIVVLTVLSYLAFMAGSLRPTVFLVFLAFYVAIGIALDVLRSLRSPPVVTWKPLSRRLAFVFMFLLWLLMVAFPLAGLVTTHNLITPISKPSISRKLGISLLRVNISLEGKVATAVRMDFKKDRKSVKTVDVSPGADQYSIDVQDMPNGEYYVYFSGYGFAPQWTPLSIAEGIPSYENIVVQLYKKRYVVLAYVFNKTGKRLFDSDNSDLDQGRAAFTHWSAPAYASSDWQIWQSGKEGELFGDTPSIDYHMHNSDNGAIRLAPGISFDSVAEAPASGYKTGTFLLAEGEVYVFRTAHGLYGKVLVEEITETPPENVQVIEKRM